MLDLVRTAVRRHAMLRQGDRVLVAVSGGPDSTALLHLLWRLQPEGDWDLGVFHLDHGLRGEESRQDALFVRDLAQALGLPLEQSTLAPGSLHAATRGSLQAEARQVRQRLLLQSARRGKWNCAALGHQRDDQVETVLMRFLRGAGPGGLAGMEPVSWLEELRLVRPLLEISRAEVLCYCRDQGLSYREDSTNNRTVYHRNRVRLELLPWLEANYNPNLRETMLRTSRICRDDNHYLHERAMEALQSATVKWSRQKVILQGPGMAAVPPALRRRALQEVLFYLLPDTQAPGYVHLVALEDLLAAGQTGAAIDLPGSVRAQKMYGELHVWIRETGAPSSRCGSWALPLPGRLISREWNLIIESKLVTAEALPEPSWDDWVLLPRHEVQEPLLLRKRRPGDRFRPRGLGGSKKVQDFLVDARIARDRRDEVPLLGDARGRLVGILGFRMDEMVDQEANPGSRVLVGWRALNSS